jgi:uncharacterized membrane protein YgdD (TMEM256/DUF423 family)
VTRISHALAAFAGLMGAAGVALAAAAAHAEGGGLAETGALFLILHAGALIGLVAVAAAASREGRRALIVCGFGLGCATVLFSGDLAMRALAGARLFPFAAPIGGTAMLLFWLAIAVIFAAGALRESSRVTALASDRRSTQKDDPVEL